MRNAIITLCALLGACTTSPTSGQKVRPDLYPVEFSGFAESPGATVEILARNNRTGDYDLVGGTTASAVGFPYGGETIYGWDTQINFWNLPNKRDYWSASCDGCVGESAYIRVIEQEATLPFMATFHKDGVSCVVNFVDGGQSLPTAGANCMSAGYPDIRLSFDK